MGEAQASRGQGCRVAPEETGMIDRKCGKCGGWMHRESLAESRREILWEWTCITCGRTYYPPDGGSGTRRVLEAPRKEG